MSLDSICAACGNGLPSCVTPTAAKSMELVDILRSMYRPPQCIVPNPTDAYGAVGRDLRYVFPIHVIKRIQSLRFFNAPGGGGSPVLPASGPVVTVWNQTTNFRIAHIPSLQSLALLPRPAVDSGSPPVWDSEQFLGLADRSSFHSNLTSLEIEAIITDEGVLGCLTVLPGLEMLSIYDNLGNEEHGVVINDNLLQGLTHKLGAATLVPQLNFISFTSCLQFTDAYYRELLTSRLPMGVDHSLVYLSGGFLVADLSSRKSC
ncbi:hypothetical protein C8R47DRAFT_1075174 [Mycena vitilis]|nr:hypothetical protein C8R47DRAFT_1075174 [Mycena vitilis]